MPRGTARERGLLGVLSRPDRGNDEDAIDARLTFQEALVAQGIERAMRKPNVIPLRRENVARLIDLLHAFEHQTFLDEFREQGLDASRIPLPWDAVSPQDGSGNAAEHTDSGTALPTAQGASGGSE